MSAIVRSPKIGVLVRKGNFACKDDTPCFIDKDTHKRFVKNIFAIRNYHKQ